MVFALSNLKIRQYTAKVGQDNMNIGVVTIFRLQRLCSRCIDQPLQYIFYFFLGFFRASFDRTRFLQWFNP